MNTNKELNKAFDLVIERINSGAIENGVKGIYPLDYQSSQRHPAISFFTYDPGKTFKWAKEEGEHGSIWIIFDDIKRALLIVLDDKSPENFHQKIVNFVNQCVENELKSYCFNGFEVGQMYWLTNIPEYEYFLGGKPEATKETIVGAIKVVRITEKWVFYELVGRPQYQRGGSDKPYKASLHHFFSEPLPYFKPDKSLNWTWEYTGKGHRKNRIVHSCFASHKINLADYNQSEIVDNLWTKTGWQFEVGKTYQHLRIEGLAIQILERDDQNHIIKIQKYYEGVKSGEPETDGPTYRIITMKWPGIEIWDRYSADRTVEN